MPPLLGTGLAAVLMGGVAFATAQASLPSQRERMAAPMVPAVAPPLPEARGHIAQAQPEFVFASPLSGFAVNSPFGMRKMPWEEGGRLHEGVDIAAPSGTPVRVTLPGTVLRVGVDGGYGKFIEVAHAGGLTSLYGHLGRHAKLKAGAAVPAGTVVGYVGSSGRSTGSHLHFEIRDGDRPLNPTLFMGRAFMTEADLPLSAAARVSGRVRVAQVANWPARATRREQVSDTANTRGSAQLLTRVSADGRVHAVIRPPADYARPAAAEASVNAAAPAPILIKPAAPAPAPKPQPKPQPAGDDAISTASAG
ncbi:M23 family metallopeptidase [Caulobacter mirabilis]|nr:M23 family metallopeptidase [Caulobacter mirabilis]